MTSASLLPYLLETNTNEVMQKTQNSNRELNPQCFNKYQRWQGGRLNQ